MARTRRQSRGRQIPQRLARDSFTTLANALPVLVFVSDTAGEAIFFNDRFQSFTGLDAPTLLGGAFPLAIHEADREQARAAWRQAVAAEEPYEVEFRLRGADGAYVWFLFRGAPARSRGWSTTGSAPARTSTIASCAAPTRPNVSG